MRRSSERCVYELYALLFCIRSLLTRHGCFVEQKYWKDRTSELEQRKLDAEERKKKIGLSGMKYTAQAMAKR